MKLAVDFDWTKVITPIQDFIEMTPRGGGIVVTWDKIESKWTEISQRSDLILDCVFRSKVSTDSGGRSPL